MRDRNKVIYAIRFYMNDIVPRVSDKLCMFIAWHLPKRLVMWCALRVGARYSASEQAVKDGEDIVPEMKFMSALKYWEVVH